MDTSIKNKIDTQLKMVLEKALNGKVTSDFETKNLKKSSCKNKLKIEKRKERENKIKEERIKSIENNKISEIFQNKTCQVDISRLKVNIEDIEQYKNTFDKHEHEIEKPIGKNCSKEDSLRMLKLKNSMKSLEKECANIIKKLEGCKISEKSSQRFIPSETEYSKKLFPNKSEYESDLKENLEKPVCNKKFSRSKASKSAEPKREILLNCSKCNMVTHSQAKMKRHMAAFHTENEAWNPVRNCQDQTAHSRKFCENEPKNQDKIRCLKCKKSFQSLARLILHKYTHGPKKTTNVCNLCRQRFPDLVEHNKLVHIPAVDTDVIAWST